MNLNLFEVRIRKLKISDIPSVEKIVQRVLSDLDGKKMKKDLMDQSKKLYVEGENFVAEINNTLIGIIGYWRLEHHPKKVAWLDWFAVDQDYQNNGVGSKLLSYMVKKLSTKHFKMLCCEKSSKDNSSKYFYDKRQFVELGRINNYWEDGGDLILLVKQL